MAKGKANGQLGTGRSESEAMGLRENEIVMPEIGSSVIQDDKDPSAPSNPDDIWLVTSWTGQRFWLIPTSSHDASLVSTRLQGDNSPNMLPEPGLVNSSLPLKSMNFCSTNWRMSDLAQVEYLVAKDPNSGQTVISAPDGSLVRIEEEPTRPSKSCQARQISDVRHFDGTRQTRFLPFTPQVVNSFKPLCLNHMNLCVVAIANWKPALSSRAVCQNRSWQHFRLLPVYRPSG
ncbi:unnamed protein product [Protopolystoma xenopodis]|uniref:Uncharacterized protein n=1 Tax=Protopolystoma xenopodis TaxID=117903 RepID=A0A448WF82_9PLAT|nr:unnamed protein product [Protopolystoma xenopodis]